MLSQITFCWKNVFFSHREFEVASLYILPEGIWILWNWFLHFYVQISFDLVLEIINAAIVSWLDGYWYWSLKFQMNDILFTLRGVVLKQNILSEVVMSWRRHFQATNSLKTKRILLAIHYRLYIISSFIDLLLSPFWQLSC